MLERIVLWGLERKYKRHGNYLSIDGRLVHKRTAVIEFWSGILLGIVAFGVGFMVWIAWKYII